MRLIIISWVAKNKITYKVCASGKCWKRGGSELHARLKSLAKAGAPIKVQKCDCLGRCKKGPNLRSKQKGKAQRKLTAKELFNVLGD